MVEEKRYKKNEVHRQVEIDITIRCKELKKKKKKKERKRRNKWGEVGEKKKQKKKKERKKKTNLNIEKWWRI